MTFANRYTDAAILQLSHREHVVEDDPRKQLELSVRRYETGEWKYEFQMSSFTTDDIELALHRSGAKGQDSKFLDVHWTCIRRLKCRQGVS